MTNFRLKTVLKIPALMITLLFLFGAAILGPASRLQADEDEEPAEEYYKEDINKDGSVNILDVLALLLMSRNDPEHPVADYTDDGTCDFFDVTCILSNIMQGNLSPLGVFNITGRVVNASTEGVEGAVVLLEGYQEGNELRDTTDAAGIYCFEGIPDGCYGVKPIIRNWFFTFDPEELEFIINGDSVALPDLKATLASFTLNGRVLENDVGLADVSVSVSGEGGIDTTLITDSNGMYRIEELYNAPYLIVPQKEDYTFDPYSFVVKMEADTTAPDIKAVVAGVEPEVLYKIVGTTLCTIGPLSNVTMILTGDKIASTLTDGAGLYMFEVPNGEYTIQAMPIPLYQTFSPIYYDVTVNGEDVLDVNFFGYGAGGG